MKHTLTRPTLGYVPNKYTPHTTKRTLARIGTVVALLVGIMASAGTARADDVRDYYCPPGPTICGSGGEGFIIQDAAGRCDATLKFTGGNASSVMFRFQNFGNGDIATPWSSWLPLNGTFSKAAWWFDVGVWEIWKAQANRGANYRVRVVGPCHII